MLKPLVFIINVGYVYYYLKSDTMKKVTKLLVMSLLLLCSVQAQDKISVDGFSLTYPAGYTYTKDADGHKFEHSTGKALYMVMVEEVGEEASVQDFLTGYKKSVDYVEDLTSDDNTLGTKLLTKYNADDGAYFAYELNIDDVAINQRVICLKKGSRIYALIDTCPSDELDVYMDHWDAFLSNFRLN